MSAHAEPPAFDHATPERQAEYRPAPRSVFVGREDELRQLRSVSDAAALGNGALIMLVGEPGIGKSALCEQLASFVGTRGGNALIGHCYPEGSAGLPYQPFVEAIETFARQCGADVLPLEMGSSASAVARMVPAVGQLLQTGFPLPENPGQDQRWMMSGVVDFLHGLGTARPTLLVLEDLHDADSGTLDFLVYLARHLAAAPLLVVGTYRDVEVDRAHPLSATLGELRRVSQYHRVHLRELSIDEIQQLLASTSEQAIPRPLAELVHRRTGGNALFAHEMLDFLVAEGLVERRDGALRRVGDESLAGQMPEGLRDVVGKRLSRLSSAANQVLRVGSVIGREFELDVVRRVHSRADVELESALEEAVDAGILEERHVVGATIAYRFAHAFFRQTLYEEIVAPRRIRLHQQVARVLEEVHRRRLDDHAAELAEHYSFSSDATELAKAVHYGEVAAKRARDVFAYGEAARLLERALVVQDLADPDDAAKRCDLLLTLGEALLTAGDPGRAIAHVTPDALALAEGLRDRRRAFRTCSLVLGCWKVRALPPAASNPSTSGGRSAHMAVPILTASNACVPIWSWRMRGARAVESKKRGHCDWRRSDSPGNWAIPRRYSGRRSFCSLRARRNTGTNECAWRRSSLDGGARV